MHLLILAAATKKTSSSSSLFLLVVLVALAAFMFLRPGRKRARQQAQQTRSQLAPGVQVRTNAGLYATVSEVSEDYVTLEVAPGVFSKYDPRVVVAVLGAGQTGQTPPEADAAVPAEPGYAEQPAEETGVQPDGEIRADTGGETGEAPGGEFGGAAAVEPGPESAEPAPPYAEVTGEGLAAEPHQS